MTLKTRKILVVCLLVLSCGGYPAVFFQMTARVDSFRAHLDEVNGVPTPQISEQPTKAFFVIRLLVFVSAAIGWLVSMIHACFLRPLRKKGSSIGWPVLLLVFGPLASPFYVWKNLWEPLLKEQPVSS